ncbi:hypothetical protein I6N96_04010 [Enterococcus sp. BWM-S5]|uniref:Uncharacterized protein n=1 Tax=Enterococcus larvae TaxID=2794352 RepID=A0ABS4CHV1_9ENTE|nr:hypothetical protein [Enterococcus larvae]MBP1045429.1 hypothetical protein [Enterococcus larvae]
MEKRYPLKSEKFFQHLEDIVTQFHSELEIVSRSELLIYASSEKRQEISKNAMKKYNQLRVHITEGQIENLLIQVLLKEPAK